MIQFKEAHLEDIASIANISEQIFVDHILALPASYKNYKWINQNLDSGFLFKILFNDSLIGSFLVFKVGCHNYQLDSLFILQEYQHTGIGKKTITFLLKRFPEASVWFVDINEAWKKQVIFLEKCGFFESTCSGKKKIRYIKLAK